MTEIETWTKFINSARYAITVEVVQGRVTLDVNVFRDLISQAGWHPEDRLIIKDNENAENAG